MLTPRKWNRREVVRKQPLKEWRSICGYNINCLELTRSKMMNDSTSSKPWASLYANYNIQFTWVQSLSCVWIFETPSTAARQASLPSPTPGVYSNSCPLSRWCHPTSSSSVIPFSFCLQSFPASGSFQMSQFFALGSQSTGVSASVLPVNIQDWFPLGWTGWISLQSRWRSRWSRSVVSDSLRPRGL